MKIKIEESQIFTIPLTKDVLAIGVIARVDRKIGSRRKPSIVFAYFFGPYLEAPKADHLEKLKPENSVLRLKCGVLYIYEGKWQIIGDMPNWNRDEWPLPTFFRNDLLLGPVLVRFYDDDLVRPAEEQPYKGGDFEFTDEDSTSGSKAVEIRLRQKLNISESRE
jgi:hypothetical protein